MYSQDIILEQRKKGKENNVDLENELKVLFLHPQALEALNKKDITEIKSYGKPPGLVETVMEAVMILKGTKDLTWAEAKKQLGKMREADTGSITACVDAQTYRI